MDYFYRWVWDGEGGYTTQITHQHADEWMQDLAYGDYSDAHRDCCQKAVKMLFKRGQYEGTRSLDTKRFRVVGVRDEDADDYHLYITNLPRNEFLPADLATLYRCRREIETLFRELKTQYELDEFDTRDPDVVKILLYAALLSLLVSRDLQDLHSLNGFRQLESFKSKLPRGHLRGHLCNNRPSPSAERAE